MFLWSGLQGCIMLIIAYPSMFIFLHLRSTWGSPSLRPVQPQPRMRFQLPKSMPGRVHLAGGKRRLSRSVPRSHSGPTTPYGTFRCAHGDTLHVTWSVGVYLYIYIVFTNQCVMYYVYLYIYICSFSSMYASINAVASQIHHQPS